MEKNKNLAPLDELSNEELFEVKGGAAAGDFVLCLGKNSGKKTEKEEVEEAE
jgi:hypothetical protein